VEVLQETLLGGGPPDEDPLPDDGVDPHPIPAVGVQPAPFVGEADNNVEDVADNVDDWDHWAMPQNNNANVGENAVLPLPMELEGAAQNGQPANNQSSILLILSSDASVGNSEEVIQPAVNQENNDEFFEPEADHGPVIVHGNNPALNMDNFMQLGEGFQNVMLAYYDAEADAEANTDVDDENIVADAIIQEDPVNNNNHELVAMQIDYIAEDQNGFLGGDNDFLGDDNLMDPEVAHLQVGLARTHFFPISEDMQEHHFSEEGMKIWDKYFAPHCPSAESAQNGKIFSIPVSWFNFITLMLATPEKFNWAKTFLNSALWEIISDESAKEESIKFAIPKNCCVQYESSYCLLEVVEKEKVVDGFRVARTWGTTRWTQRFKRRGLNM
jgi:hypothetical protein